jgi:hypothetical protein
MRTAVRQTRPKERLVRRSKAEAPAGFNRQRQWRLKTIRLVLPNKKPSPLAGVFVWGQSWMRPTTAVRQNPTTGGFWSPKAPRRGESARGNGARNHPPGPTKIKNPPLGGFFGFGWLGLDENRCSTNATAEAISPLQRSEGAHRVSASGSHFVHKYSKLSRDPHGFG